ncbi:MAG: CU044_2847 family protein [Nocardiopsaceae bacterium]|nr:CU044_2847 family protein [Nocardiopsaceae bacterium]
MAEIVRFTTEEGASVLIEAAGSSPVMRDVGGRDVFRVAEDKFETVLGKIRSLSDLVAQELADLTSAPDEVTVEMGISVNAEADVFIARAATESGLKVTMTWCRDDGHLPPRR